MNEPINRPSGFLSHDRPSVGSVILTGVASAAIVTWYVYFRPPANDSERFACAAAIGKAAAVKAAADAAREAARLAELARLERVAAEKVSVEAWKAEHLAGLVQTSVTPRWWLRGDGIGVDPRIEIEGEPSLRVSKSNGWYDTGDTYQTIRWEGQPVGYLWSYGNAFLAYVPAPLADAWYRQEWDRRIAEFGASQHTVSVLTGYGRGVQGGDYNDWARETMGEDELVRLAQTAIHRYQLGYNQNEQLVAKLIDLGIDARLIELTNEKAVVEPARQTAHGTIPALERPVWVDRVDGSRWVCPNYAKIQQVT